MSQPRAAAAGPGGGAAAAGAGAPGQNQGGWDQTLKSALRSVAMFLAIQMAMKYGMQYLGMGPKPAPPAPVSPAETTLGAVSTTPAPAQPGAITADPFWALGTPLSMLLFTSTSPTIEIQPSDPLVAWDGLTYGNWKDQRETDVWIDIPQSVRADNGSLWLDILLVKGGGKSLQGKGPEDIAVYRKQLTRFLPKKRVRKEKMLIGGAEESELEEEPVEVPAQQIVAHWANNLTLTIVTNGGQVNVAGLPAQAAVHYSLAPTPEGASKAYFPPVFPNDFWLLRENMYPINSTDSKLPLHINYYALGSMKFNIYAAMTQSMDQVSQQQGAGNEMDEVKRMLTETSPWLLITTAIVTLLHTVFEFLAFSSDVSHWRKKDRDLVGVSLRTILTNCFVQLVILLYLQDSSEETSFMILFGQGIGLLIEAWKITKVVDVRVREAPGTLIGYRITFEDKKELSEEEKKTQEYDKLAFRLVSYGAIPLLAGYTVYSLLYETHRGWYSFVVTTLAQAIYMFGFVQLVPQLIINYKLKSVAHMPMKAMMYKTLSTVVDDFFAFCIRMPWLHRLACFRDDVVFLILLYQRWIYRVDYSRANEYGQVVEGMAEPVGDVTKVKEAEERKKQ